MDDYGIVNIPIGAIFKDSAHNFFIRSKAGATSLKSGRFYFTNQFQYYKYYLAAPDFLSFCERLLDD